MFRKSLMALAIASLAAGTCAGGGFGRRGQAARHDADRGRRREGRQQGRHDPRVHRGHQAAGRLPAGNHGVGPDPFASEKPRLVITGKDMAAQADKLTEGTKELLKRYPTMRVDVYPTHRTVAVPQRVLDNTPKNADRREDRRRAASRSRTCWPAIRSRFRRPAPRRSGTTCSATAGSGYDGSRYDNWNVDAAGVPTLAVTADAYWAWPIYDPKKTGSISAERPVLVQQAALRRSRPPQRRSAAADRRGQPAEAAAPRVAIPAGSAPRALAPDLAYDTPNPGAAGAGTYDDVSVFNGAIDRFDWKLVGKKEMYVPVQQLSADLSQGSGGHHEAQPPQSGPRALGAASRLGRRGDAEARQAPHLQQARRSTSTRTAGRRSRPTSTTRAASSTARASRSSRTATTCRRRSATRSRSTTSARACTTSAACSARTTGSST